MPNQTSNDWKVAIISAICTAIVTAVGGWFMIEHQLNKGQVFWKEQQRITNRDTVIKMKISFIQEIEQLGSQHFTNAFYHMVKHLNNDREYANENADTIMLASAQKDHSEQLAALYRNFNILVSRLRGTRFMFSPQTTAVSERLLKELETASWHPVYDNKAFIRTLKAEFKGGRDGLSQTDSMTEKLTKQMHTEQCNTLLCEFIESAMHEVSLQLDTDTK